MTERLIFMLIGAAVMSPIAGFLAWCARGFFLRPDERAIGRLKRETERQNQRILAQLEALRNVEAELQLIKKRQEAADAPGVER